MKPSLKRKGKPAPHELVPQDPFGSTPEKKSRFRRGEKTPKQPKAPKAPKQKKPKKEEAAHAAGGVGGGCCGGEGGASARRGFARRAFEQAARQAQRSVERCRRSREEVLGPRHE